MGIASALAWLAVFMALLVNLVADPEQRFVRFGSFFPGLCLIFMPCVFPDWLLKYAPSLLSLI
jgi:hypothetical protein